MTPITRRSLLQLAGAAALASGEAIGAERWLEGTHYSRIPPLTMTPPSPASITEVFSYGCPGCNGFLPYMQGLARRLPAAARLEHLPASWLPAANWPVFQRAYLTAKALGIADKAHEAMFAAVWSSGELAIVDPASNRPRKPLPSMQDVARFYQRVTAVPVARYLETSVSFQVETGIRRTDALIRALRAESTPTLIVNGRYRLTPVTAGGANQAVELALLLSRRIA